MNAAASRLKSSGKFSNFLELFPDATAAPHSPEKAVQEALFKAEREKNFYSKFRVASPQLYECSS